MFPKLTLLLVSYAFVVLVAMTWRDAVLATREFPLKFWASLLLASTCAVVAAATSSVLVLDSIFGWG